MEIVSEVVEAQSDGSPMAVLRKRPAGESKWPGVAMFHDGPGIREATHEFANKLAAEGFDVIVPDLYHRQGRLLGWELHERQADPSIVDRIWALLESLTDAGIQADIDAALEAVGVGHDEPLLTIGFCLGARAVARAMLRSPERFMAGAMWHPSYLVDDEPDSPHLTAAELQGPLFIGIGDADEMQPLASHTPFLDAVRPLPRVEIAVYPGADHGYTWDGWPNYNEAAATASFASTVSLFKRASQTQVPPPLAVPAATVSSLVVDCLDAVELARFWQGVLGGEAVPFPEHGVVALRAPGITFDFVAVDELAATGGRLHLDLASNDPEASIRRVIKLGGARAEHSFQTDRFTVMTDPEGNEFCILSNAPVGPWAASDTESPSGS
ncbi:MAG: dienelactone hydrolase family protein [Acidimicrobiales bacterium]